LARLSLAGAWMFFSGFFVPLHTRGVIQLDSRTRISCCAGCGEKTGSAPSQKPLENRRSKYPGSCAVCFLIAHLDLPTPVLILDTCWEEIRIGSFASPTDPAYFYSIHSYHSRAPPPGLS